MTTTHRSSWRDLQSVHIPRVGRLDWVLFGVLETIALVEGLVRPDVQWRVFVTVLAMTIMPAVLWRRSRPLLAVVVGFGAAAMLSVLQLLTRSGELGLYSMLAVLLFLYSLVRWGSGREATLGFAVIVPVVGLGMYVTPMGVGDTIGEVVFLSLFIVPALVFRYRAAHLRQQRREIRNEERLSLARELHDTVAHHVSAIAVQAQAGGVVAKQQPDKVIDIFAAIESEASRTLVEMRTIVQVLREDGWDAYSTHLGVADLPALAVPDATPVVEVRLPEGMVHLPKPVDAAIYRIVQEALTNALRHAQHATHVLVEVAHLGDRVTLRVTDNGAARPRPGIDRGFGLTGMAERAHLLGGTFNAGPGPEGGWVVDATLPVEVLT